MVLYFTEPFNLKHNYIVMGMVKRIVLVIKYFWTGPNDEPHVMKELIDLLADKTVGVIS